MGDTMSTTLAHINTPPDMLAGKIAVITGASRGIGAAAARVFAAAGATVVLAARDEAALGTVAADIIAAGGRALLVATDVGDAASVQNLIDRTLAAYGRLDAAFNNAGFGHLPAPLADLTVDDFDRSIQVNLRGVFLCLKYEITAMRAGGAIVNMSSTAGLNGVRGLGDYAAAKHGVIGLTKSAALDYAERNIRVNAIAPGPILNEKLARAGDEAQKQVIRAVPLRRIGRPEEVAAAAAWLCSDQAAFITGAAIPIDGGRLAGS
jgi:NAD(P)-dependent dehydrogenase (short-subunit alcohol dehydrogenase family)